MVGIIAAPCIVTHLCFHALRSTDVSSDTFAGEIPPAAADLCGKTKLRACKEQHQVSIHGVWVHPCGSPVACITSKKACIEAPSCRPRSARSAVLHALISSRRQVLLSGSTRLVSSTSAAQLTVRCSSCTMRSSHHNPPSDQAMFVHSLCGRMQIISGARTQRDCGWLLFWL